MRVRHAAITAIAKVVTAVMELMEAAVAVVEALVAAVAAEVTDCDRENEEAATNSVPIVTDSRLLLRPPSR